MAKLFLDAGYEKSKTEDMAKVIMNISFISENQIEQLLTEAGFTNVTRFYATGFFCGLDLPCARITTSKQE